MNEPLPDQLQREIDQPDRTRRALNNAYVVIDERSNNDGAQDAIANVVLHEILDALAALSQQPTLEPAPEAAQLEPVATVTQWDKYTFGRNTNATVVFHREVPAGTKLYAHPTESDSSAPAIEPANKEDYPPEPGYGNAMEVAAWKAGWTARANLVHQSGAVAEALQRPAGKDRA